MRQVRNENVFPQRNLRQKLVDKFKKLSKTFFYGMEFR